MNSENLGDQANVGAGNQIRKRKKILKSPHVPCDSHAICNPFIAAFWMQQGKEF